MNRQFPCRWQPFFWWFWCRSFLILFFYVQQNWLIVVLVPILLYFFLVNHEEISVVGLGSSWWRCQRVAKIWFVPAHGIWWILQQLRPMNWKHANNSPERTEHSTSRTPRQMQHAAQLKQQHTNSVFIIVSTRSALRRHATMVTELRLASARYLFTG